MATKGTPIVWARCRGRNGFDDLLNVPADMAREVLNCHFYEGGIATKRGGSTAQSIGGDAYTGHNALFRFVPGQDETAAELFIVDNSATNQILRVAAGTSADALTLANDIQANDTDISTAVLNGKLWLAFNSDENRLHVFDPGLSTTAIRRGGLKQPAAPTAADTGSGSYAATARYYKVAYTEQRSSVTVRRSELSASLSFTPSGSGTHARVTKPAAISESETHWELYASADDTTYYRIATTAVGTTTFDDNETVADYDGGDYEAEAPAGTYVPFPSVKYLISTGSRLIGFGVWETSAGDSLTPKAGRVFIGPVLDSTGTHDDERISNTTTFSGWIDISRNAGSVDRGLGRIGNLILVFTSKGIWALTPTENAEVPYRRQELSSQLGAVSHQAIVAGEDRDGRACLYFLDPELGPYRYGPRGFEWIGKDVKDLWDTVNLGATGVVAHGVYHKSKGQVIWWIATGSSNDPDRCLVFDVNEGMVSDGDEVRYGWSTYTGDYAAARCSVMFSETIGATMSRNLKPYVGASSGTTLLRGDTTDDDDNGTAFQAYVDSPAFGAETAHLDKHVVKSWLIAPAASASIQQAFIRASGDETNRTASVSLAAQNGESDVRRKFEDAALVEAPWFQVRLGDASAVSSAWSLTRWGAKVEPGGEI